jgi:2-polyprenyl-3-methyl-5-hydroxy-6-metoxy-1,4-benzoquinol methylase
MNLQNLISPEMLERQRKSHARTKPVGIHRNPYGVHGGRWANTIALLAYNVAAAFDKPLLSVSVLDYGCGKGTLSAALKNDLTVANYDPVTFPAMPLDAFDIVVCTDVLLFVERDKMRNVLQHIKSLAAHAVFIGIPDYPETRATPLAKFAGLNRYPPAVWIQRLKTYWPQCTYEIINNRTPYLIFTGYE